MAVGLYPRVVAFLTVPARLVSPRDVADEPEAHRDTTSSPFVPAYVRPPPTLSATRKPVIAVMPPDATAFVSRLDLAVFHTRHSRKHGDDAQPTQNTVSGSLASMDSARSNNCAWSSGGLPMRLREALTYQTSRTPSAIVASLVSRLTAHPTDYVHR